MTQARFLIGDVRAVLDTLEPESVDLVLTSPPFLALRSYLPADHPDKPFEIGSEPTPGEFIDTLLDVVEACARVLAPHGSMCFELGDTYSGSGGAGGDYLPGGLREGQERFDGSASRAYGTGAAPRPPRSNPRWRAGTARPDRPHAFRTKTDEANYAGGSHGGDGWPLDKSLCLIPEIFRFSLVYGFNPLTGRVTPRWRARNVVRWCRPNPPVGALGDKFRPGTSDMVVICRDRRRYFDLDAVRQPLADSPGNRYVRKVSDGDQQGRSSATTGIEREMNKITRDYDPTASGGAPPLDWWKVSTQPYKGSHYATWPAQLCEIPIKSMCPQRVCTVCGKPAERITEPTEEHSRRLGSDMFGQHHNDVMRRSSGRSRADGKGNLRVTAEYVTTGWTDCGCSCDRCEGKWPADCAAHWRNGVVLDPFAGSGTTLQVATGHGRAAIGIDLDARNADLALQRVGPMFLTVENPVGAGA